MSLIKSTYNGAKCRVLHGGTLSSSFEVKCGVRQSCILSSVLFLVVIGDIINSAILKYNTNFNNSGKRWTMSSFLQHLDYVDDMSVVT